MKRFGGCFEGPQSVCVLRFGSLRKAVAWQEPPAGSQNIQQSCRTSSKCSARAGARADVQHPEPQGSATQYLCPFHSPHSPDPASAPLPKIPLPKMVCLLNSACPLKSMLALQGNHPQVAVDYTVTSHLFLGVYELFYQFCPSSAETSSATVKLFLIPALCLLLFESSKTQMLMYKYMRMLYSSFV